MTSADPHDQAHRHDPVYDTLAATNEFAQLRSAYRRFALPATIAFLLWYLLYVVMSNWAHDFMATEVAGNINVALVFGLLQFATTFVIAYLYSSYSSKHLDPLARHLDEEYVRVLRSRTGSTGSSGTPRATGATGATGVPGTEA